MNDVVWALSAPLQAGWSRRDEDEAKKRNAKERDKEMDKEETKILADAKAELCGSNARLCNVLRYRVENRFAAVML